MRWGGGGGGVNQKKVSIDPVHYKGAMDLIHIRVLIQKWGSMHLGPYFVLTPVGI